MRKILSLLVVLCTVLTLGITVQASPIHARNTLSGSGAKIATSVGGNGMAIEISDGKVLGQLIDTKDTVTGISISTASYGNDIGIIKLDAYMWKGDYSSTIKTKPIATKVYEDFADGASLSLDLVGNAVSGSVLLTATGSKDRVAIWASSKIHPCYVDGVLNGDYSANVTANVSKSFSVEVVESAEYLPAYEWIEASKKVASGNSDISSVNKKVGEENVKIPVLVPSTGDYYAAYAVDFGNSSPKGAVIDIYNDILDVVKMQMVADDPIKGEVLCEFHLEIKDKDGFWEEIPAKINTKLTGKHIIYITGDVQGGRLANFKFTKETPEDSWDEIRLTEFKATNNFELIDTYSDTWTFTDLLGRKSVDISTAGKHNPDKQVGLFYWTWHAAKGRQNSWHVGINQQIINSYPGPESDIKNNFSYGAWQNQGMWNESIYGVYNGFDEWVMRKQMELLAAVGVDGLFFDSTNGTDTFTGGYMQLAKTLHEMHNDGIKTPGMSFILPFGNLDYNYTDVTRLWETMYSIGLYSDTWYYFDGKPILMGYPDKFEVKTGLTDVDKQNAEILDFFTFRPSQPSYFIGPTRDDHWPWLEVYPQHAYGKSDKYGCECVSVGVAMNAGPKGLDAMNGKDIYGRSYTYKDKYSKLSDTSKYYGYNFQEQWQRAHELNPEFVFVTGWNEWVAGHYSEWGQGTKGAYPDQYNDEYSRDLEPTKGEMKDVHYYLFANEIRKFKGVRETPVASAEKTIDLSAGFSQWADVGPDFVGYKGGTAPRDSYVQGDSHIPLTNDTGRNDIVLSKVARDSENLYFYVKTADAMTPYTDPSWMRLFINTDRVYKTGWEGYDFVLNRVNPTENTATLEKWNGESVEDWKWEKTADVEYTLAGNEMMIKIPKSVLGISGDVVDIEFKWNDNMQKQGDIMDVYTNGDTAPVGRFNYHYITDKAKAKKVVDEPVDPATKFAHYGRRFLVMALDKNYAYVYGEEKKIDEQSDITAPMIIKDKTMVPVRFLAESLGATVSWDDATKTVTIYVGSKRIRLTLDSKEMRVEKEKFTLQSPATEIDNRIYVPLRDIVEALDMPCFWVEPGMIIVGPEDEYTKLYTNGTMEDLMNKFNLLEF